jgi:hypothetical protein
LKAAIIGRENCDHGEVPSELLMNRVLTPYCLAVAAMVARFPPEDAESSQIHIALPSNGLLAATGGGETVVGGAEVVGVGVAPAPPPWPMVRPRAGSWRLIGIGSGMVSVGDPLAPTAREEETPTSTSARVTTTRVTTTIADGRPSPETRRPRVAHLARRSLLM